LIELMVVVSVIAILAAIALPSYRSYVIRGNLVEGTQQLAAQRAKMEQFYQDARTYVTSGSYTSPCSALPTAKYWSFSCSGTSASAYTITATGSGPVNGFVYTINQTNAQSTTGLPSGWGSTPQACWITRKQGTCS
jgi:type IV pilus assembly protein PilE